MKLPYVCLLWLWLFAAGIACAEESVREDSPPPAVPQILQAEELIKGGKSEQAYALLEPLEPTLAGDIRFDYLLGVSALNSGKASLAVFAFERVQATDPRYRDIGLWIAIAYYQSGDRERAKSGFAEVAARSDSAEARSKAERFLSVIRQEEARPTGGHPSLLGHVEIGIGHDSNITNNSAAYFGAMQLAGILPEPPSKQGGMESILNVGAEGRIPISNYYVFASVADDKRIYPGNGVMNSDTLVAKAGMDFASNGNAYKASVLRRQFSQQGTFFPITGNVNDYAMNGVEGRARFQLSTHDYLGLVAQYSQLRFLATDTEDTNQVLLGINFMHSFQANGSPLLYLGYANLGDRAVRSKTSLNPLVNEGITMASRDTDIVTLYLQYSVSTEVDIFSTDYIYFRRDSGAFARDAVIDYGKDKTRFLSLGINWRPRPQWTVRSQLGKTSNNSNISLYSYSKTEATVILRRDFN